MGWPAQLMMGPRSSPLAQAHRPALRARMGGMMLVGRTVTARAASIGAGLAMSVLVARQLGPSRAGVFFVLLATLTGAATLGRLGTDNLALKLVATNARDSHSALRQLFLICAVGSALTAGGVYFVAIELLSGKIATDQLEVVAWVAAVSIIPAAIAVTASAILRALGLVAIGTIAELGSTPALTTFGILGLSLTMPVELPNIIYVFAIANTLTACWALPLALRNLPTASPSSPNTTVGEFSRTHGSGLLSMMGTSLMFYLLTWAPVLTLGLVSSMTQAAYFNVAARVTAFISLVPSIQTAYLTPRFAAYHYKGDTGSLNQLVGSSTRRALCLGGIGAALIIAFPSQVLLLFGSDYAPAHSTLQVLAVAAALAVALGPVNGLMLTCGLERFASKLSAIVLVSTVGLMLMVARNQGASGVALVSGVATILYALTASATLQRRLGIVSHVARSANLGPRLRFRR